MLSGKELYNYRSNEIIYQIIPTLEQCSYNTIKQILTWANFAFRSHDQIFIHAKFAYNQNLHLVAARNNIPVHILHT